MAFIGLGFVLWQLWQRDHQAMSVTTSRPAVVRTTDGNVIPSPVDSKRANASPSHANLDKKPANKQNYITVNTDVLSLVIDRKGGSVIRADLMQYAEQINRTKPEQILSNKENNFYIAQSSLAGSFSSARSDQSVVYDSTARYYHLEDGKDKLQVVLSWRDAKGVQLRKIFTFRRGHYDVNMAYQVKNGSSQPWKGYFYAQIQRQKPGSRSKHSFFGGARNYDGGAIYTDKKPYKKLSYGHLDDKNLNQVIQGGWLAMQQPYFLVSWIADQQRLQNNRYYSRVTADKHYTLGFVAPQFTVQPNKTQVVQSTLYIGPEIEEKLESLAKGLNLTIDYGWLWMISAAIFWILKHINQWVGNWGVSIILVTVLIRGLFFKLSETSYRSMAKMRQLQPKIEQLKQQYGNDRQKLSEATLSFYRREKLNPLGGCLPMLVQFPFFIALYYVLLESVQLRHAPFMLWIHDLSGKDPYFILPILMGLTMLWQQRMNPPPADPTQAKVMMLLPVFFTFLFLTFPSGLVLYWLVNNCLSVLQQWYIMRRFDQQQSPQKAANVAL